MVKLALMSPNLILILNKILTNQTTVKYLNYNLKNPLSQPDLTLPANSLMLTKLFPYPFDPTATIEDQVNLRVYYPMGVFQNNEVVQETQVYFDIIVAKSLWLTNDGQASIRAYEIMRQIVNQFHGQTLSTVGILHFHEFIHLNVNSKFDAIRLIANMTTIG